MGLVTFAATLSLVIDPIFSTEVLAHLTPVLDCAAECRVLSASLRYASGEVAVSAVPGSCTETVAIRRVPFGAHLFPQVSWECGGKVETVRGAPVTVPPYLTNVEVGEDSVWVPALAHLKGDERLELELWGEAVGRVTQGFSPREELVVRGVTLHPGRLYVRGTFRPYGVVSNTRVVRLQAPNEHVTATEVGCASTPLVIPLLFFRRRRFPSARGIC
ncbi:MAG: hypothetical protein IPJ65_13475 [Archangiaceae bacterium]|nr:hypothetical protein [Archangiaceae bacterium]